MIPPLSKRVDDIIGMALLIEHLRRSGYDICRRSLMPAKANQTRQLAASWRPLRAELTTALLAPFCSHMTLPRFTFLPPFLMSDGKGDLPTLCGWCFATENCRFLSLVIFISCVRAVH